MLRVILIFCRLSEPRFRGAADVAAQRYKAIEYVVSGGTWDQAQNTELIPPDNQSSSLTGSDLKTIAKQSEQDARMLPGSSSKGFWKGKGGNTTDSQEEKPRPQKGEPKGGKAPKGEQKRRKLERKGLEKAEVSKLRKHFKQSLQRLKSELPHVGAQALGTACFDSNQTWVALGSLAECGVNRIATLHRQLKKLLVCLDYPTELKCCRDLLPIPFSSAKVWWQRLGRQELRAVCPLVLSAAKAMLLGLNVLFCAGWSEDPILPEAFGPLRSEQHALLHNIWLRAADVAAAPAAAFTFADEITFLRSRRVSYDGVVSVRRRLVADQVIPAWPAVGEACVCPILEHIDPHLAEQIANPKLCLLPPEDWPSETPVSRVHADTEEWIAIVRAGIDRGMLAEVEESEI